MAVGTVPAYFWGMSNCLSLLENVADALERATFVRVWLVH